MAHAPTHPRHIRLRVAMSLVIALVSIIAISFFGGTSAGATNSPSETEYCDYGWGGDHYDQPCSTETTSTTTTVAPTTTSTTVASTTTSTTVAPTSSTTSSTTSTTSSTLPPYIGVPTSIVNATLPPAPPTTTSSTPPPVDELALTGSNGPTWMLVLAIALLVSGIALMIRNRRALRTKA